MDVPGGAGSDDLLGPVAQNPLDRRADVTYGPLGVGDHDDVQRILDEGVEARFALLEGLFGPLALGDVAHDGQHVTPLLIPDVTRRLYRVQAHLDADLLAGLPQGGQLQKFVRVDVGPASRLAVACQAGSVAPPQTLGDQLLDVHLQRLIDRIAEDLRCGRIPQNDPPVLGVRDDDRVPYALEEVAYPEILRTQG